MRFMFVNSDHNLSQTVSRGDLCNPDTFTKYALPIPPGMATAYWSFGVSPCVMNTIEEIEQTLGDYQPG